RSTMEGILERIPTPPMSDGKYPIFLIPAIPLDEWITPEDKRLPEPAVTEEEITAAEIKEEHKGLAEGKGMIRAQNLAHAVEIGYWRSEIKALDESEKKLRESRENGMMFLKRLFEDQHKVEESKSYIDEVKRHSSIAARQLDRNIQQSPKPTILPLHSTPTSQPLYVSWSNISDGSDQAPATATTQTNLLTALLAGGAGSNSPVLRGVGDLLVSSESMLLPALDIRFPVYEACKINHGAAE